MTTTLYTRDILRLATRVGDWPMLAHADARIERRATVCGSRVAVAVALDCARLVEAIGLDVKACALGQASSAVLAAAIIGADATSIASARDALAAFLEGERDHPGDWPGIAELAVVRDYPARHASVRLAFEAAAEAVALASARGAA